MTDNHFTDILLTPFSWLYRLGTDIRNKLFDRGILSVEEFSVPVISVGNLAAGGTGKTPHIEYLIRLLSPKYKVAVLSRGYKRKSKGFILADNNTKCLTIGDEPFQLFRKFPEILVAVDANRRRGIKNLLALPEKQRPEVILLDDAFQHRYVKPSLSILLTECENLFLSDKLLPVGRLREPASNKKRAQIIVVTKCPPTLSALAFHNIVEEIDKLSHQSLFFSSFEYSDLEPVFTGAKKISMEEIKEKAYAVILLAGIASPRSLTAYLKNYTRKMKLFMFPDHHQFTRKDMEELKLVFNNWTRPQKIIITTEKDAARLLDDNLFPKELKPYLYYLPVKVNFVSDNAIMFNQIIENHVENFEGNRILA